jgi:hypothetical protein
MFKNAIASLIVFFLLVLKIVMIRSRHGILFSNISIIHHEKP